MTTADWAIIHEASQQAGINPAAREKLRFREAAQSLGAAIIEIPANWARLSDAEEVFGDIDSAKRPIPAILNGYIHPADDYAELFAAARARNFFLLNDPSQYQRVHSMAESLPLLGELTPKTAFVEAIEDLPIAIEEVGLPAFVKGDVQSRKDRGWSRCVARTGSELEQIAADLLDNYPWSEGRVVIRELVNLRHHQTQEDGFPVGREFRAIVYNGTIAGLGYYWPIKDDPLCKLPPEEERIVRELACEAAERVSVPFVVIDIGQLEGGEWIVIETGDPQTAGYGEIDLHEMLRRVVGQFPLAFPSPKT